MNTKNEQEKLNSDGNYSEYTKKEPDSFIFDSNEKILKEDQIVNLSIPKNYKKKIHNRTSN